MDSIVKCIWLFYNNLQVTNLPKVLKTSAEPLVPSSKPAQPELLQTQHCAAPPWPSYSTHTHTHTHREREKARELSGKWWIWNLDLKEPEGILTPSVLVSPISREIAALKRKSSVKWDVTWKYRWCSQLVKTIKSEASWSALVTGHVDRLCHGTILRRIMRKTINKMITSLTLLAHRLLSPNWKPAAAPSHSALTKEEDENWRRVTPYLASLIRPLQ